MEKWIKSILFLLLAINAVFLSASTHPAPTLADDGTHTTILPKTEELNTVEQTLFSDGEYSPTLQIERIPTHRLASSPLSALKKGISHLKKIISCFAQAEHYKQFEISTPFYCFPVCRYYVFALQRLLI
mgnify:CR=1 FL=1